jgi:hypothetical protein
MRAIGISALVRCVGAIAIGAALGCGGAAPSQSTRAPAASVDAERSRCAEETDDAFVKCTRDLYARKRYPAVIDACKSAVKNVEHTEEQKTKALGVCMSVLPSALFHQGRSQEARELVATLCHGSPDEDRISIAARATLVTMVGMDKSVNNEERIKSALMTFSGGCEVEPGRVADRALELAKE